MLAYMILKSIIRKLQCIAAILGVAMLLSGCVVNTGAFEPNIDFFPSPRVIDRLPSAFLPLTSEEKQQEWGRELSCGLYFAHEFDLYRAITCYKRALFLCEGNARSAQIEYHILEAYFMGCKYKEVIETYELGLLSQVHLDFPALKELLLMLIDSYTRLDMCEKAERIQWYLQTIDPPLEVKIEEYQAFISADFPTLYALAEEDEDLSSFLDTYQSSRLSVKKAQFLNAVLPGAGFYYVGQTKTALTALLVNALFTYAAIQFFDHGYVAAGIITTSFEMGWYLGGINGAGLAAHEHNQHNWNVQGKDFLIQKRLFPLLMFQYAF